MRQKDRGRIPYHPYWARKGAKEELRAELDGTRVVVLPRKNRSYSNHIETAGFRAAAIVSYGNSRGGTLKLFRHVIFPALRRYPNETGSSLDRNFKGIRILVDGNAQPEKVVEYAFDGILHIVSRIGTLAVTRTLCAARHAPALVENLVLTNTGERDVEIEVVPRDKDFHTPPREGADGRSYFCVTEIDKRRFLLKPQESARAGVAYCAFEGEAEQVDSVREEESRRAFLKELGSALTVITPDKNINAMAEFAKLRAAESIFETKGGLMHGPGGGNYYAALWTNDQCEYVNPLFGYLGYDAGEKQSENCFRHFAKYAREDAPVVSSVIAEGDGVWHGAGDRGDSAMFAYGLAFYLLASGKRSLVEEFLPRFAPRSRILCRRSTATASSKATATSWKTGSKAAKPTFRRRALR